MRHDVKKVKDNFDILGDFISAAPYGSGHINDTYRVVVDQGGTEVHYIFQRINHNIFKNPPALMDNIRRVTDHINSKIHDEDEASRHSLYVIRTTEGKPYYHDLDGNFWRAYIFIEKAMTYDIIESEQQAFQAAQAFGTFQKELVDIPGKRLHETIPDFHHTPRRIAMLEAAIAADVMDRVKSAQPEIDFVLKRKAEAEILIKLQEQGQLPERITHNDTKLNNVMIDDETGEGICVIDLDTVMPGLIHYDFGDMVRTSTSPAAEDEKDLSKVYMQFNMFEALLRGYLSTAGDFLTPVEKEYLPFAGKLVTLTIGLRFLTDYLQGDIYFKTRHDEHNLDRCRTQFKLIESIEQQMDKMKTLLDSID
ncbi:aminoglycoside phosphotransferase family protein [Lentisphaerota bacterium ZTH]|nr:aminoglycoside phosphotransferase family protein [Lentisphaerota bacterium]WET05525.1 aminoglycoside phosphotransferase family protein [Lentisphaerota bacterium ZTH]